MIPGIGLRGRDLHLLLGSRQLLQLQRQLAGGIEVTRDRMHAHVLIQTASNLGMARMLLMWCSTVRS